MLSYLSIKALVLSITGVGLNVFINKQKSVRNNIFLFLLIYVLGSSIGAQAEDYIFGHGKVFVIETINVEEYEDDALIDCKYQSLQYEAMQKLPKKYLIEKMNYHLKEHDIRIDKMESLLKSNNLWSKHWNSLYNATRVFVGTYAGCRNFLTSAVIAIVDYGFEVGLQAKNLWNEYSRFQDEAKYHANEFDYYMYMYIYWYRNEK